jgi:diphthamide synthase (EF-2-diphthine--ammonia ligase)
MDLEITLSTELTLPDEVLPTGASYTEDLVQKLQENNLDAMFENGEAHTLVFPRTWKKYQ